jgi:hypothetical protein
VTTDKMPAPASVVAIGCLTLGACVVGAIAYRVLWSGPNLVATPRGNTVEVAPLVLEYNLGIDEVELRAGDSGALAVGARRGQGKYLDGVVLTTTDDLASQFREAGWDVVAPANGPAILQQQRSYRLRVRGTTALLAGTSPAAT